MIVVILIQLNKKICAHGQMRFLSITRLCREPWIHVASFDAKYKVPDHLPELTSNRVRPGSKTLFISCTYILVHDCPANIQPHNFIQRSTLL